MVESSAARLDSVFHALADPTRRAILHGLTKGERTVTEIAQPHRMTLAAVSKHLKVLESAELIARERRGSFHIVRLQAQSLKAAEEWIAFYSRFWNQSLDNLEKFLEEEPSAEARQPSAKERKPSAQKENSK
jgi:DNA-binding transcriptional ArsR family regulator